ncbi:MAG: heat-inducible transcription repressor HrcA [Deltaproteobacteria bacterium]|nr:heat-inducible transcription repressor HrcA [Deltaproteobacteria bacterium]
MAEDLGNREKSVLRAIVHAYITRGEPVGSSQLVRGAEFDVSSATLRGVMADLEALGYLVKPHTSAGRVPTSQGYRFYVDALVKLEAPPEAAQALIQQNLSGTEGSADGVAQDASRVLHAITRHAGVVVTPRAGQLAPSRIEFVRLREDRVLAVLVVQGGQVVNRPLALDIPMSGEELVRAANRLNELFARHPGRTVEELRAALQRELEDEAAAEQPELQRALRLGVAAAVGVAAPERVVIEGAGSFLERPEFADVERARAVFRALDEKGRLLQLLDRVQKAAAIQVFIGAESALGEGAEVSVIASPYGSNGQVLGAVGVIGPTRMDYQKVIPLVGFTAQVLSKALESD